MDEFFNFKPPKKELALLYFQFVKIINFLLKVKIDGLILYFFVIRMITYSKIVLISLKKSKYGWNAGFLHIFTVFFSFS